MLESFADNKFTYQKLTEDEQRKRRILGRLTGIIADSKNATRNGRLYSIDLWKKVFDDPIMEEKIKNRCCFGECGHPADREEVDMEKIAICLAEKPKIGKDGNLYGVFDILDTPCGKILKTLCDYGCNIGISSRGTGDLYTDNNGQEAVDPDTYNCECFDAVLIPAVKSARMQVVNESLNSKPSLKQALVESYNNANTEDKKVMKETLENLDIKLTEATEEEIPYEDPEDDVLVEDAPVEETEIAVEETPIEEPIIEEPIEEPAIEAEVVEEPAIEEAPIVEDDDTEAFTVGGFINELKDFDDGLSLEWKPIVIDDKEYGITGLEFDDSEDGKIVVSLNYNLPEVEEDNTLPEDENPVVPVEVNSEEEVVEEAPVEAPEEAIDNGDEEVLESLKEAVRLKDALETECKELRNQKAVSDTEVAGLREELEKYKLAFKRTSELAAKASKFEKENSSLLEQLSIKDTEIKDLKTKVETTSRLNEDVSSSKAKVKELTERLEATVKEAEDEKKAFNEQITDYRAKLKSRTDTARAYKAKYEGVVEGYIATKANMLGVRPADIKGRLVENYTLDDIDKVCEDLLYEGRPLFGLGYGASMKISESKEPTAKKVENPDDGYAIDDSLLELAGLK